MRNRSLQSEIHVLHARALLQITTNRMNKHVTDKQRSRNNSLSRIPNTNQTVGVLFPVENHVQTGTHTHGPPLSRNRRRLKQPHCKSDTSPSTRAYMENVRSLSSRPLYAFTIYVCVCIYIYRHIISHLERMDLII
jgi:hypothetical protein